MKTIAIFSALLLTALSAFSQPATTFTKLWETVPGLKIPESVLYDPTSGIVYVSNIDGNPSEKDKSGFISTLSPEGKIQKMDWVTALDAPKGMGIFKNHLFVTNIDEVVEIDIKTAAIVKRYPVAGSKFLNDIAIDSKTGKVFITDSGNGQVYTLTDGNVSLWQQGSMFKGANGLCMSDNELFIGASGNIVKADLNSGEAVVWIANTGGVDGLFMTSDDKFIYSDWKGSVFIAGKNQEPELLLNTSAEKVNAADFGVIASKNMILIPTFMDNKVVGYSSTLIK
jgi:DNA-binding beta-propeller fold protein YncE